MEAITVIFGVGTGFHRACKEYLLIKKVNELQHDIELIKGSFFSNALDFVEKAFVCENDNNVRFFLESAYNNFCQSVKMYSDSIGQLMETTTSVGMKENIADLVKTGGSGFFSRNYDRLVDGLRDKASASDKAEVDRLEKETEILEMSYVGKAMCEYHMKEYSLCLQSIDAALGLHFEQIKSCKGAVYTAAFFGMADVMMDLLSNWIITVLMGPCKNYFYAMNRVGIEKEISLENLSNRKRAISFLQAEIRKNSDMKWLCEKYLEQ